MMEPTQSGFWADVVHACRGYDGNLGLMMLACAFSLFAMMAIGILVSWQVG